MRRAAPILAFVTILATACSGAGSSESGKPEVVASLYPLAFVMSEVAGEGARVVDLTPPGAEPHDLELTPGQVATVRQAALLAYLGSGFQPAVERVAGDLRGRAMDLLALPGLQGRLLENEDDGEEDAHGEDEHLGADPHVWLDPGLMEEIALAVRDRMKAIDPDEAAGYGERAARLVDRLRRLDTELNSTLSQCARRELVTSHAAFEYLARRYRLTQVGISGLSPETEPSPRRLAEVAGLVRERGVTTIFFERLVSSKIAESLAREVGVGTAMLDPVEGRPESGDYFDAMRANLAALRAALDCP